MTDERFRDVERRWQSVGTVEDELQYLVMRLRAGSLPHDRLLLAASCGHDAARRVLGDRAPPVSCDKASLLARVAALSPANASLVALSAADLAVDLWAREAGSGDPLAGAVAAARAYLRSPTRNLELAFYAHERRVKVLNGGHPTHDSAAARCSIGAIVSLNFMTATAGDQLRRPISKGALEEWIKAGYYHPLDHVRHDAWRVVECTVDALIASQRQPFWREVLARARGAEEEREREAVRRLCRAFAAAALLPEESCRLGSDAPLALLDPDVQASTVGPDPRQEPRWRDGTDESSHQRARADCFRDGRED